MRKKYHVYLTNEQRRIMLDSLRITKALLQTRGLRQCLLGYSVARIIYDACL